MKFARYTFLIAGIYGLLVLVPQYFIEAAGSGPAIAMPEFYYGFIGLAIAFQLVFIIISTDPQKYRALMLPSIVEKFSFGLAVVALVFAGRVTGQIVIAATLDLVLGVLFIVSWFKVASASRVETVSDSVN